MLPPVEDAVLRNNPDFAALYTTLTTVILNPDGSTKAGAAAKERAAIKAQAKTARLRAAKNHLLAQAIASAVPPPPPAAAAAPAAQDGRYGGAVARRAARASTRPAVAPPPPPPPSSAPSAAAELPPDLKDLLLLLPPLLHQLADTGAGSPAALSHDELDLLLSSRPFTALPDHLPRLAALVSDSLQAAALGLARVASPATNPSFLHRTVPALPAHVASLRAAVADARARLAAARKEAAAALLAVLDQQAAALAALVRALEAKHGPVARSLELRAAEVALDAQAAAADAHSTRAAARRAVYPAEAASALRHYAEHLRDSKMRLEEALREREALLQKYGVDVEAGEEDDRVEAGQKGRTMREMARAYEEMGQQMQDIKGDLARLTGP